MFIDTHCHLSSNDYEDIDLVILENKEHGVDKIIVSGCEKNSVEESVQLANKYSEIYLTLGYHPSEVDDISDDDLLDLKNKLQHSSSIVGVGEIGLDYHYGKENSEKQKNLFRRQLDIAKELGLPVVIHSRDAAEDTIDILRQYSLRGVIHCFSGSTETANIYVKMGYKLGIGGVVTFQNSNLYKVVQNVGIDNIVLETDSPYLAPVPYRGTKNSSKNIPIIAQKIADILDISLEQVEKCTTKNAIELFDLNNH